jgi:hypothetical protein
VLPLARASLATVALAALLGAPAEARTETRMLVGHAGLGHDERGSLPVAGATVRIRSADGTRLGRTTTNVYGAFVLRSRNTRPASHRHRVEVSVTGGTVRGEPFRGVLRLVADGVRHSFDLAVNPATTAVARYRFPDGVRRRQRSSAIRAERLAHRALGLAPHMSLHEAVQHTNLHLDGSRLAELAQRRRAFGRWVGRIVRRMRHAAWAPAEATAAQAGPPDIAAVRVASDAIVGDLVSLRDAGSACRAGSLGREVPTLLVSAEVPGPTCAQAGFLDDHVSGALAFQRRLADAKAHQHQALGELRSRINSNDTARAMFLYDQRDGAVQDYVRGIEAELSTLITALELQADYDREMREDGRSDVVPLTEQQVQEALTRAQQLLADAGRLATATRDDTEGVYEPLRTLVLGASPDPATQERLFRQVRDGWLASWAQLLWLAVNVRNAVGDERQRAQTIDALARDAFIFSDYVAEPLGFRRYVPPAVPPAPAVPAGAQDDTDRAGAGVAWLADRLRGWMHFLGERTLLGRLQFGAFGREDDQPWLDMGDIGPGTLTIEIGTLRGSDCCVPQSVIATGQAHATPADVQGGAPAPVVWSIPYPLIGLYQFAEFWTRVTYVPFAGPVVSQLSPREVLTMNQDCAFRPGDEGNPDGDQFLPDCYTGDPCAAEPATLENADVPESCSEHLERLRVMAANDARRKAAAGRSG